MDNLQGCQPLEFEADRVNQMTEAQWRRKGAKVDKIPVTEEFLKMC
jgi:hypothetical protein